jgi:N-acylneuraminate cytidylyltransferase/CMP-N,N'-diacetyllegionaminic acid synthase
MSKPPQTLGIILARAGSQGLANKHLLPLLGRPVIEYTFDHGLTSKRLTRLIVSSDCARIRLLAHNFGIESIDRPASLATADATVQDACLHALQTVEARSGTTFDAAVVLYGNVPIRPPGAIDDAIDLLFRTGCDSVRTLSPVAKWHPAWMHRLEGDVMRPLQPGSIHRRQELEPIYLHDGGAVVVTRASLLRAAENPSDPHAFFGDDRRGIVTGDRGETIEIDHQRDLYWAEAMLRDQQQVRRRAAS